MVLIGLTDGDGTVTTSPESTSGDTSDETEETTFDPDTQTLGTTSLGTMTDADNTGITVTESDSDPSDSSPAGGAGAEEATERFAGLEDETLADSTTEEIVDVGNAASDVYTAHNRGNKQAAQQAQEGLQDAVDAADSSNSGDSVGVAGQAAVALLVGVAVVGGR
jgi:hypothetical protein